MKNQPKTVISLSEAKHLVKLANLNLSEKEIEELLNQFVNVLEFVSKVQSLNTKNVVETSQVTGLVNVFREDKIDESRMLTQKQALLNSKKSHNGYFEVEAILEG